jgi:hypothetical protein
VGYLDEFYFLCKRMEKMRVDYARNSYHDEFIFFASLFFLCSVSFYVGDVWRHGEQVIDGVRLLKTHDR